MAISVDPLTDVIYIPKADLVLIQASPEVRELDLNAFHLWLKDWEDEESAITRPRTHNHSTEVSLAGLTYARIIEILSPYTIEFEDGQYTVNCVGANHNISDKKVANQVSLIVNNAAGLITNTAIEYASFNGGVTIDVDSPYYGTTYPIGTPQRPVNNIDDAYLIASIRGFPTIFVNGDLHLTSAVPPLTDYSFVGQGMDRTTITIDSDAVVDDCFYRDATITGTLDGNSRLVGCVIDNLIYVKGFIESCVLSAATITLAGSEEAHFLDCWSGIPGLSTPVIDLGGSGQSLALRNYNGGIKLINKSGPEPVSIDLNSGQIILESSITNGEIVCRGIGKLTDNSNGATVLADDLLSKDIISKATWGALSNDVFVDMTSGNTGTVYPMGTAQYPVNNITDAVSICVANGKHGIVFQGQLIISQNLVGYRVKGSTSVLNDVAVLTGVDVSNTVFDLCTVTGTAVGSTDIQSTNGIVADFTGWDGLIIGGGMSGTVTANPGGTIIGKSIAFAGTSDVVNANGAAFVGLDFNGVFTLQNLTGGGFTQLGGSFGEAIIDTSCNGGFGRVYGTISITDNATNITWVADKTINKKTISDEVWSSTSGLQVLTDLSFIAGIEGGKWTIAGGQMIFYLDDNTTEIARFDIAYDGDMNPIMRTRV